MRFSLVFTAFMAVAARAAQDGVEHTEKAANAFKIPRGGYKFEPGEHTMLTWDPTTDGTVTLRLQDFTDTDIVTPSDGYLLADSIPNGGSFNAQIPKDLPKGTYSVEIIPDGHPDDANFTPKWKFKGVDDAEETETTAVSSTVSSTATSETTGTTMASSMTTTTTSSEETTSKTSATTATSSEVSTTATSAATSTAATTSASTTTTAPTNTTMSTTSTSSTTSLNSTASTSSPQTSTTAFTSTNATSATTKATSIPTEISEAHPVEDSESGAMKVAVKPFLMMLAAVLGSVLLL